MNMKAAREAVSLFGDFLSWRWSFVAWELVQAESAQLKQAHGLALIFLMIIITLAKKIRMTCYKCSGLQGVYCGWKQPSSNAETLQS